MLPQDLLVKIKLLLIMEEKLVIIILSLIVATAWARKCTSDRKELDAAIFSASPGDTVCIANGVYEDWMINVNRDVLTLAGETGGLVLLKGRSQVKISGKRIRVKNLMFTAPLANGGKRDFPTPIEFGYNAEFSSVSDCMIINHTANVWVQVRGNNNEVSRCTFKDKPPPLLTDTGKEVALSNIVSVSDSKMHRNKIHHNKFIKYDPDARTARHKHGSAEAVYVKIARSSGRDVKNLGCSVYKNYFYKIDSEEETIGIKSSGNEVYENAIEFCYGGISLRHGKNNIVRNNYIKGRPDDSKLDYGINVHDENHLVEKNWVMDVGQYHGIKVVGGNGPTNCDSCHVRAKNVRIIDNKLINSALHLGKRYHIGRYMPPEDIEIKNVIATCDKKYAMITGYGLKEPGALQGKPYTFHSVNKFSGEKLAYSAVLKKLYTCISQGVILWSKSPTSLGDYGEKMIRRIECEAGPSWEPKKKSCLGK